MNAEKSYLTRFIVSMILYVVFLSGSLWAARFVEPLWGRALLALTPVIPVAFAVSAILAKFRTQDEFQQRIQFEAAVFSLVGTGLLTFAYGFLQDAGFPEISMIWVLPLMISLWGIGGAVAGRKYR